MRANVDLSLCGCDYPGRTGVTWLYGEPNSCCRWRTRPAIYQDLGRDFNGFNQVYEKGKV